MYPRGRQQASGGASAVPDVAPNEVNGWLAGRLPDDWFSGAPEVVIDRDEVTIIGTLRAPETGEDGDADAAAEGRARRFREQTRDERIVIAREAQRKWGRQVAWGVEVGDDRWVFTSIAVPAMTRLRQPERVVLDTLVEAGVARSRAEALAWCVKLVGQHTTEWLSELQAAQAQVAKIRTSGPTP